MAKDLSADPVEEAFDRYFVAEGRLRRAVHDREMCRPDGTLRTLIKLSEKLDEAREELRNTLIDDGDEAQWGFFDDKCKRPTL
jgi:hypothetical protein